MSSFYLDFFMFFADVKKIFCFFLIILKCCYVYKNYAFGLSIFCNVFLYANLKFEQNVITADLPVKPQVSNFLLNLKTKGRLRSQ